MKKIIYLICFAGITMQACNDKPAADNPLLAEFDTPFQVPPFDKIHDAHYLPAFREGMKQQREEIDAITPNPEAPTFANTIEALEFAGEKLGDVSSIFYNLLEAESSPEMQAVAEQISPMMTEYSMYVSLNDKLFQRIKDLWNRRDSLGLEPDQYKLLDDTYKSFARNGAEKDISSKMRPLGGRFWSDCLSRRRLARRGREGRVAATPGRPAPGARRRRARSQPARRRADARRRRRRVRRRAGRRRPRRCGPRRPRRASPR